MNPRAINWEKVGRHLGIGLLLSIGLIHLFNAPEEYEEVHYMGFLFTANFLGALVATVGLRHQKWWGWLAGLLLAAGSIVGYVLSRSVGMPGMEVEEWLVPLGLLSLLLEALFIAIAFFMWPRLLPAPYRRGYGVPTAALLAVVMIGGSAVLYQAHTVTITPEALAEEYGLEVSMIATSMMDGILDVRLKIIDPDKAQEIFADHDKMPYLVLPNNITVLPPLHMKHQDGLLSGRTYYMLYPNPDHEVQAGTAVSLVFGNEQLGPIMVQ